MYAYRGPLLLAPTFFPRASLLPDLRKTEDVGRSRQGILNLLLDETGDPVRQGAAVLLGKFFRHFFQIRLDADIEDLGF